MKRIAIFVGLKLAEIVAAVVGYGLLFGLGGLIPGALLNDRARWFDVWIGGPLVAAVGLMTLVLIGYGGWTWVRANWRKAGEITERGKR